MKVIWALLLMSSVIGRASAQEAKKFIVSPLTEAGVRLKPSSAAYNPGKAFDLIYREAEDGNLKAMNALAILYAQGLGVQQNGKEAIRWFDKAAKGGYTRSWYNLGLLYKAGIVVDQDFVRSFKYFAEGERADEPSAIYGLGFMYFKGLGCTQGYPLAVKAFKKAATQGSMGAMYMLGICYRNGYGLSVNRDSAKFWLGRAASLGYKWAKDEMNSLNPENNSDLKRTKTSTTRYKKLAAIQAGDNTASAVTIGSKLPGKYSGMVITYDWSGEHVISQIPVKWEFTGREKLFHAVWKDGEKTIASVLLSLLDSTLQSFEHQGTYQRTDHYSPSTPVEFEIRETNLQYRYSSDSVILSGPLKLWAVARKEPEKPMYITLSRQKDTTDKAIGTVPSIESNLSKIKVWPNPFTTGFDVEFDAKRSGRSVLLLSDRMGNVVYRENNVSVHQGINKRRVDINLPVGTYVLAIISSGEQLSANLIKI